MNWLLNQMYDLNISMLEPPKNETDTTLSSYEALLFIIVVITGVLLAVIILRKYETIPDMVIPTSAAIVCLLALFLSVILPNEYKDYLTSKAHEKIESYTVTKLSYDKKIVYTETNKFSEPYDLKHRKKPTNDKNLYGKKTYEYVTYSSKAQRLAGIKNTLIEYTYVPDYAYQKD